METILSVEDVWKKFSLYPNKTRKPLFGEYIRAILTGKTRNKIKRINEFWALREISFELKRGETLGIVGLNGAGKSTLLKVILGRTKPEKGIVTVNGKMGGLIELGAGFQPEYSGLKNIYLNAEIMGIGHDEIEGKIQAIIEFSELGKFIDAPVKNYSSGMYIRLGFSIAIHFIPDLVICDEILAVGDFEFRQKCLNRINELKKERTFILVSHSTSTINSFCDKAMFLHKGRMVSIGKKKEVLRGFALASQYLSYVELNQKINSAEGEDVIAVVGKDIVSNKKKEKLLVKNHVQVEAEKYDFIGPQYHNKEYLEYAKVYCDKNFDSGQFVIWAGDPVRIVVKFKLIKEIPTIRIGLPFFDDAGTMLIGPDSRDCKEIASLNRVGEYTVEVFFKSFPLNKGQYYAALAINNDPAFVFRKRLGKFQVLDDSSRYGIVRSSPLWRPGLQSELEYVEIM